MEEYSQRVVGQLNEAAACQIRCPLPKGPAQQKKATQTKMGVNLLPQWPVLGVIQVSGLMRCVCSFFFFSGTRMDRRGGVAGQQKLIMISKLSR